MIPTKEQNPNGLHRKYNIQKANGEQIEDGSEYFVLRLDSGGGDPVHIQACRDAILVYAEKIKDHLPDLSKDLIERYTK